MREAASRGFWVASRVPYGYRKIMVQDGAKKRPTLEPDPDTAPTVQRIFNLAEAGLGILDITRTLNDEGIANPTGRLWSKNGAHIILRIETYTGTLVWGTSASHKGEPVRVEKAFPAIISKTQFRKVNRQLRSRAPRKVHPRRVGSSYLLSGLVKCRACRRAMSGQDSKSGKFAYYVYQSLMKRGSGACDAPRLNARRFEDMVVDRIRDNILFMPRIREHRERQERLEATAVEARAMLSQRRVVLDDVNTITTYAQDLSTYLKESELTERRSFIESFVREIVVQPGATVVRYSIPMPQDSSIEGRDAEEVALHGPVLSTVKLGGPARTELRTFRWEVQISRNPVWCAGAVSDRHEPSVQISSDCPR